MTCKLLAVFLFLPAVSPYIADADELSATELFELQIRPIFVARCQKCHGDRMQWAGLRLDSGSAILTGGDSGPVIVPGKPEESELFLRISETDDGFRMPPAEAGEPLDQEQMAALKRWIELGAPWPQSSTTSQDEREKLWRHHWAFQPVRTHVPPPVEKAANRIVNPVDQFILAKLDEAGLEQSPPADRRTLIRRATYDLTGLPPTAEEVAAFVNEDGPRAYERLIDRLLASPRYGEQWGRHWLDVARYSDTKGYVYEREERTFLHSSLYRDWVIQAFNNDLPYNRFVLLQLAADQAAPGDPASLAAMGFVTLGRRFRGVMPDIIDDHIDVVSRGLLGLTVSCARCHDHKYDPIPTADYYSLYGVFQNSLEKQVALPRVSEAAPANEEFQKGLQERAQKLQETMVAERAEANERIRKRLKEYLLAQRELDKYPELGFTQLTTKNDLISGIVRRWQKYLTFAEQDSDPVFVAWIAFNRLNDGEFASRSPEVTRELQAKNDQLNARIAAAFVTPPNSISEVADRYARLFDEVDRLWKAELAAAECAKLTAPASLPSADDEELRQVLYSPNLPCVIPDEPIVSTEPYWDFETATKLWKLQREFDRWILKDPCAAPHVWALSDRQTPVDQQILKRGNPADKGAVVPRQFLGLLAGPNRKPFASGSGRFEMAQAIVDPANPLTARVWVNRVWQHHFGSGLVSTPSDFGVRASPPSHPELLDWLSSEFVAQGWSTKSLHRILMLSSTYQQSSPGPADTDALQRAELSDPDNRLLWRMNLRRLSFEQFHDSLVALSGEIDFTMGGKGTEFLGTRRSVYAFVDRQFLPTLFTVFDFANPDLHSPQRVETTSPQQALFALNHPFVAGRAKVIAAKAQASAGSDRASDCVSQLYQVLFQRAATTEELQVARRYLTDCAAQSVTAEVPAAEQAWCYGYGEIDELAGRVKSFTALPYFTGFAWQGGINWPDPALDDVQLTAFGGHAGGDLKHAVVRRWTADRSGKVSVASELSHQSAVGDGVRGWIVASNHGILQSALVNNRSERMDVEELSVDAGETLDFVVDLREVAKNDFFVWAPTIRAIENSDVSNDKLTAGWNSEKDFTSAPVNRLSAFEQLAHTLLISNELMYVD